jgi:hypothetical protein
MQIDSLSAVLAEYTAVSYAALGEFARSAPTGAVSSTGGTGRAKTPAITKDRTEHRHYAAT